jgi:hypothetical protein
VFAQVSGTIDEAEGKGVESWERLVERSTVFTTPEHVRPDLTTPPITHLGPPPDHGPLATATDGWRQLDEAFSLTPVAHGCWSRGL